VRLLHPKHTIPVLLESPFVLSSLALGVRWLLFVAIVAWLCTFGVTVVDTGTIILASFLVVDSLVHSCLKNADIAEVEETFPSII
jgi:hypothetical protein